MKPDHRQLMLELQDFADRENLSWKKIAGILHVTPNTISNWKTRGSISAGNRRKIMELLHPGKSAAAFRTDPLTQAMDLLWNDLQEADRAKVYAYAAGLHAGKEHSVLKAAEPHAAYHPGK